jgi:hypothetical protein
MSWVITGAEKTPVDPLFGSVVLLVHGNGTITDSSSSPKTVTVLGDTQISTAQSKFGASSIYFDGTSDRLSVPNMILNNDFTAEAWLYKTAKDASAYSVLFGGLSAGGDTNNTQLTFDSGGEGRIGTVLAAVNVIGGTGAGAIATNAWSHVAWARSGATVRQFVNGSQLGSGTSTSPLSIAYIGGLLISSGFDVNGYLAEIRVTAACRYTANFAPPTAPFPDI